jgi:hypothetical protein
MDFRLSKHAAVALRERNIHLDWVAATLNHPSRTLPHSDDPQLRHVFRAIPEFSDRVLRVVYNHTMQPPLVITVYFDRTMKGKL